MALSPRHEHFATLVAGGTPAAHAYVAAGYSENGAAQSAARLMRDAGVQRRIEEIRNDIYSRLTDCTIRDAENRVRALQDRWDRLNRVMFARGADPDHRKAPGGETGLLVRTFRTVAETPVEEFAVDTGLLRELREIEKQAAQELGQWTERTEASVEITIEQRLMAARTRLAAAAGGGGETDAR